MCTILFDIIVFKSRQFAKSVYRHIFIAHGLGADHVSIDSSRPWIMHITRQLNTITNVIEKHLVQIKTITNYLV